jgi:hypothetical protein
MGVLKRRINKLFWRVSLGRQPGIKPDALNTILDRSATEAKRKITRRSPQLEALIQEINSYLAEGETKQAHG